MKTATAPTKRQPSDIACTVCGAEIATCTVGGAHGMLRDAAARATKQLRAEGKIK